MSHRGLEESCQKDQTSEFDGLGHGPVLVAICMRGYIDRDMNETSYRLPEISRGKDAFHLNAGRLDGVFSLTLCAQKSE
jgi:hypothetical protein